MMSAETKVSDFAKDFDFEDIRPFHDHETPDVVRRLIVDPLFMDLINYLWPNMTFDEVKQKAEKVETALEFQLQFMHAAIRKIVEKSSSGLTSSGFDKLDKKNSYLFIANHRDILLDAAILQILLVENGFQTSEITFGSNLKDKGFITDFGRLNRMFTVLREGTSKELYEISRKLSAYIRHTLLDKKASVWIAQRNGRTKDGMDLTQSGLLKMLNISGRKSFSENFSELNIVPLTISYEYEPCDYLKAQEIYLSNLHTKYNKAPGEDLNSIVTGINQFKGRIHLAVGTPIEAKEYKYIDTLENENDKIKTLQALIDKRIYSDFKLFPVNYIANDVLHGTNLFEAYYSAKEKKDFIEYVEKQISKIEGERDVLRTILLKQYAQPTINKMHLNE
ncbi:MAG: glycerol acyltransferase [Bacteroidia bacterium]|nr:glycerol acyltransferase [Bacteroidia bacterium]